MNFTCHNVKFTVHTTNTWISLILHLFDPPLSIPMNFTNYYIHGTFNLPHYSPVITMTSKCTLLPSLYHMSLSSYSLYAGLALVLEPLRHNWSTYLTSCTAAWVRQLGVDALGIGSCHALECGTVRSKVTWHVNCCIFFSCIFFQQVR